MHGAICRKYKRTHGIVWATRWSVTLPDGTRRFGRITEATKRECEDEARQAMDDARRGGKPKADALTVAGWLRDWLADHARTVRPQTAERYESEMRNHVLPYLGDVRLQKVNERELRSWLGALERNGVSPAMIAHVRSIFGIALNRAVATGLLPHNSIQRTKAPRVERTAVVAYEAEEVARLHAAAEAGDAIFVLALDRGVRRGELLGLKWDDVDLDRGRLQIRRQLVGRGGQMREAPPKSRSSERLIVLPDRSRDMLRRLRVKQIEERLQAGSLWQDSGYVFTDNLGQHWSLYRYNAQWRRLVARAGVRYLEPHACRHTFATLSLAAGVHPKLVQETLGHSSIAMTLDRYSHVSEEMQREAAAKVEALLSSVTEAPMQTPQAR